MNTVEILTLAHQLLIDAGWAIFHAGDNIYEKTFETATAPHTAFIRCRASNDDAGPFVCLEGTYYSEGNNVLAACSVYSLINETTLQHVTAEFALRDYVTKAEQAIDNSYARRLFLKYGK